MGQQSLLKDLRMNVPLRVWADSSAATGISNKSGLGNLRHVDTHYLWIQEKVRAKALELRKVRGDQNPADLFTKFMPSQDKMQQLIELLGCEYRAGRSTVAPQLRNGDTMMVTKLPESPEDPMEAARYDESRLPHLYSENQISAWFPDAHTEENSTDSDYNYEPNFASL